jgi:hypothetical protein
MAGTSTASPARFHSLPSAIFPPMQKTANKTATSVQPTYIVCIFLLITAYCSGSPPYGKRIIDLTEPPKIDMDSQKTALAPQ